MSKCYARRPWVGEQLRNYRFEYIFLVPLKVKLQVKDKKENKI